MLGKGENLERHIKLFFGELLKECGFTVIKNRQQKSGTQDGFDNEIIVVNEFYKRFKIYIECKDYSTKLNYSEALVKIPQIISSYKPDLFIFISPKEPFSNPYNDSRLEDFYNEFEVPIEFLTPDNQVEELLSLDRMVYKAIYNKEPLIKVDRSEKIEWFKKFVLSTKPLRKIILDEIERYNYITHISLTDNYIERSIIEPNRNLQTQDLYTRTWKGSFEDNINYLLNNNDKIGVVLLGNPGSGKSCELRNIAISTWENRDIIGWIPFFREIRTFTLNSSIEDYLPKNWDKIPQLLIVFDGLDEISQSQEFGSKLEKFILDNRNSNNNIKFVLSCRTNIFENVIRKISNFEMLFLDSISYSAAIAYLEKLYGLSPEDSFALRYKSHNEFLENPYYLRLFGEYYLKEKKIPKNKAELLDKFVENRLEDDYRNKFKTQRFDKALVEIHCKKLALTMEAMQINEIDESHIFSLFGANKNVFTECCFSQKVYDENSWKFEHRNLQEYFAAKSLQYLSFEDVIEFIRIGVNEFKTHPSWLNTISYLLGMIDQKSSLYKQMIDWLIENDPEVLFKADSDRLTKNVKFKVFKDYFTERCLKQTLWIRTYDAGVLELAKFADSEMSIEFLLSQLKNKDNNRRTRISAADLLSYMSINERAEEVIDVIIKLLKAPLEEVDFGFKADVLHRFKQLNYHKESNFIDKVIEALGEIDHHQVISALLYLIEDSEPDKYGAYIKNHSIKIIDERCRKYKKSDNLSTGEEATFLRILKKFNDTENLIFALKFYLKNPLPYSRDEELDRNIEIVINKLALNYLQDESVYMEFLEIIDNDLYDSGFRLKYEELIFQFFKKTNTIQRAFNDLYNKSINISNKRHFLVLFSDSENIKVFVKDFLSEKIEFNELIYFRNNLSYHNFELALEFQKMVEEETSINFPDKLETSNQRQWAEFHKTKYQVGFDLLFNKSQLARLTKQYFRIHPDQIITWDNNKETKVEYRKNLHLQKTFPQTFINIINDALRGNKGKIIEQDVINLLNTNSYLFFKINEEVLSSHSSSFEITVGHKEKIYKWCLKNLPHCDFNGYSENSNRENNVKCELVWRYRNLFDFEYPEKFLLEMLFIDGQMKMNGKYFGYEYIINSVSKDKLNERIICNLNSKELEHTILHNHIMYALDKNLSEVFHHIEEYLYDDNEARYIKSTILRKYFEKTKDIEFLKRLINNSTEESIERSLYCEVLKLLIENKEASFVIDSLLKLRDKFPQAKDSLLIIKFLIRGNYALAFKLYNSWLLKDLYASRDVRGTIEKEDYSVYTNKEGINDLMDLFEIGCNQSFKFDIHYHPKRIAHEALESISKMNGEGCELILGKLEIFRESLIKVNGELFEVNTLINDITRQYFNHKSKPLSFRGISQKIEEFKYEIL
ncbi:NACHT domain-containing protein [Aequorivita capsosiphonis]|uniref:NACHT domain-containing protein n=1 Tax=Aequorivita capsosiphonis TaxID=487317 RepID=UPI0004240E5A|nr:NACHT domain-containing protein [Aequorivita capsosiphonis]